MNRMTESEPTEKKKIVVVIPPGTNFNDPLPEEISPNLALMLENERKLQQLVTDEIKFADPVLEQADNGIIYPNTINVIQGQAGVHKSRLAETMCAALLKRHDCKNELLGFNRKNADADYTVIYVDLSGIYQSSCHLHYKPYR